MKIFEVEYRYTPKFIFSEKVKNKTQNRIFTIFKTWKTYDPQKF